MKNIVIIGAGDLGKEVVWLIEDINKVKPTYLIQGFLDDDVSKTDVTFHGYRVLGQTSDLDKLAKEMPLCAVIAIQDGSVRKAIVDAHPNFTNWESIIHPTAVISSTSHIGIGCVVFPMVTVSVDTELGNFSLYNIHSTVCNDCKIGDFTSVMSGSSISEHVVIGEESFFSTNSCVYPHRRVGRKVEVAAGAVVNKDCKDNTKVGEKFF